MQYHRKGEAYNTRGVDVFGEDWDNLIILDACRYDTFDKLHGFDGQLDRKISRGSSTLEFLNGNVAGRTFPETTYITANPVYEKNFDGENFSSVHNLFLTDSWDGGSRTVLPETFVRQAVDLYGDNVDKRIVFHLVQPHNPFIGEFGRTVIGDETLNFWSRVMTGELAYDDRDLYASYVENVLSVLSRIDDLLDAIAGKTVITADHGQMIGERASPIPIKEYGHPPGIHTPELVEVPWLVIDDDRREITAGAVSASADVEDDVVEQRLRDLGYA
jgi:hypothetical protein